MTSHSPDSFLKKQASTYLKEKTQTAARKRKRESHLDQYLGEEGIVRFVSDILRVEEIAPYQEDLLRAFVRHRRVSARGPHGLGKTALAAWCVLWVIAVYETDVKAITTASAWRQLTHYLWPEIKKWAHKADWSRLGMQMRHGHELLERSIKLPDKEAFPVASNDPQLIEGAHASVLCYIFDEAKAIPAEIWDAAEGAFATGDCFALAISTPGVTSGRFYDIHQRKPGYDDWWVRHVTLEEAVAAGRVSPTWATQRAEQWGAESAIYKNRVLGEFDDSGEDVVIPLRWVELANQRWEMLQGRGPAGAYLAYGVDPAYKGADKTAICRLRGNVVEELQSHAKEDTMQTSGRVAAMTNKQTPIAVDVIGVGAGVVDRLRELGFRVISINVSNKAEYPSGRPMTARDNTTQFINLRAAIWWSLREALDPQGDILLAVPPDDELTGDLTSPTYWYNSSGKIQVESKDDMRERLGRSPDKADAVGLAYAALNLMHTRPLIMV